ncbi:MAG TPA: antitoxin [Pseudonocardiaceae bacterium]|nr:antitoxin [Pseudonocardiaceae bacterium]
MLGKLRKLMVLAALAEGARRFMKANPEAAAKLAERAAGAVDQATQGRFHDKIEGFVSQLKGGKA